MMLQRMKGMWDQQVGLDEYLPGTPNPERWHYHNPADDFPYDIMGRGNFAAAAEQHRARTAAERLFREHDAVRRRQFPSCFEEACAYGNLQAVILMWAQGTVDIPTRRAVYEGNNASSLMWAAFKGHLSIVRFLVDHDAPLEAVNGLGHTALQWAITGGHTDVVRYLLDHGADPSHRDRQGFDASFAAVQSGHLALLLMLTEDAAREGRLLQTSDHGLVFYKPSLEPQAQAATRENPRTKKPYYLLNPQQRDVEGHTLMHWAAYRNSPATCQYLLDHWGYDVDAQDSHGRTPLVWAAREGFSEVMELLLSRGADRHITDSDGWTALQHARVRNHPEAVYVLESYPVSSLTAATAATTSDNALADRELSEMADSVKVALLEASAEATINTTSRGRYVCVRDRRAAGTLRMIRTNTTFAMMAIAGPVYLALTFLLMKVLPPIASYLPFGMFFFKNVLWSMLSPRPTQTSRSGPPPPLIKQVGMAMSIAESVRGTWRFRLREPINLFIWLTFLVVQVWAWNSLGLVPLFSLSGRDAAAAQERQAASAAAAALWGTSATSTADGTDRQPLIHYFGLSLIRLLTFQSSPLDQFQADTVAATPAFVAAEKTYMAQSNNLVRWVLMLLLLTSVTCAVLCKLLAGRSMMRASEEGTLRTSPLWRILASRQYRWLHPRFFSQERHMQIPLRAFYCRERDIVVRGYDGYSSLLDSPIGRSNHLLFVLSLTCFALFELLVMTWGTQQTRVLLRCPERVPWYRDAFFAFQTTEAMAATVAARGPMPATTWDNTSLQAATPSMLAAEAPVLSFAWLNTAMEVWLHGLPCRQYRLLDEITMNYVKAAAASAAAAAHKPSILGSCVLRGVFLFRYYIWPTRASMLGVWVLHYSAIAAVLIGCVAMRQWIGVWCGATRMELANPLAQGSDGELVSIFPKDAQQAQRVVPIDDDEERYYATVCPSKARTITTGRAAAAAEGRGRCLYAEGNGIVNVLAFLLGRNGKRWVGAMTVSSHNAPVKTPMLS
ncbi:Ankyrin repeats (3 copies)/Ankyrin repeats (many copies)/Ankyrin repeat/DHHC palmitoyltransferase [Leishmania donovani]|uniref:Ankyrin_repeats_(3_copies)/Ankyrin_repeats_(Many_ copies)/Ankyrin_repeat/DHHC_palmitoyltransferase_putative/P fam:PF12796/Pfam:PF13637/Pfam:PF00023/Pfam:PF13857/Pfam:PF1 3606/Pfam:PF01529 n=1 Tax=Leishmania donovani TaxID=5661 RepID=A0A6J8F604_LEIDO|nr:Ankyrin repeats (3 copies)/Ankyrin repeats (many copies)/Ankyrin repeat/DHHC palmitoyltransferase [Leishmania donovani]VDZ41694.1 Ankyrin_repeats_(3_copies)/Ankyrin_repeats_(many_copies)/Ankyrin_repeat/DHHC_palmitoyltransferase_putative/Pfam:PF12796/Pfam:PF13637/Pfam:PF00023/Pfam:PF13857/Pfam:PF13606/Pfam:PF01529 [Leishmania donovani]